MKKIFSFLLAFLICAMSFFTFGCNDDNTNDDDDKDYKPDCISTGNHNYTVENKCSECDEPWVYTKELKLLDKGDHYSVERRGNALATDIIIPYGYKGKPVTEIEKNAFDGRELTSVTMPDSITVIGDSAFSGCKDLTNITFSNNLTTIGANAFYNCDSLVSVTIPSSVTVIKRSAFKDCSKLATINLPDTPIQIQKYAFDGTAYSRESTNWYEDFALYIGNHLIETKSSIKKESYTVREGTISIAEGAFYLRTELKEINFPDSLLSISEYAFPHCDSLTNITLPNNLKHIGVTAFAGCYFLNSVTIPTSVTEIGGKAFYGCINLKTITYKGTREQWDALPKGELWDMAQVPGAGYLEYYKLDYTLICEGSSE